MDNVENIKERYIRVDLNNKKVDNNYSMDNGQGNNGDATPNDN